MNFNPNSYMGYSYTQNINPYMQPQQQMHRYFRKKY